MSDENMTHLLCLVDRLADVAFLWVVLWFLRWASLRQDDICGFFLDLAG